MAERIFISTQCFAPTLGGIETYLVGLAETVAAAGHETHVFADGAAAERAFDATTEARYAVRRYGGPKPIRRFWKGAALKGAASSAPPDRVFFDSWKSLEPIAALGGLGASLICLAHGMEFPGPTDDAAPRKHRRIRRALAAADQVLANSRYTAELARPFMTEPSRLRVVPPPIGLQPEVDAAARAGLAARLGRFSPLLVALGRLEPRKGVDRVIAALPALTALHPNIGLAVAGAGPDRERLEAIAAAGAVDQVMFLGRVDEAQKAALYELADLFAMPTRREGRSVEGFGLVYLEAAWRGAPALAGREGGAADAVLEGRTGALCDGADQAAVTAALQEMLRDPRGLRAMGAAAAGHARAQVWPRRLSDFLG